MIKERIYSNAPELLKDLAEKGMDTSLVPIDVDRIASLLGISVVPDLSLELRDSIGEISFTDDKPVVRINPLQNNYNPRRRFTLAHEIGHYCLHSLSSKEGFKDSRKTMSRSESFWDSYESEANSFAAQLLMPRPLIIKEGNKVISSYKESDHTSGMPTKLFVERMASLFEVSNKAMQYRLKSLKILS